VEGCHEDTIGKEEGLSLLRGKGRVFGQARRARWLDAATAALSLMKLVETKGEPGWDERGQASKGGAEGCDGGDAGSG
jgi:hypothetical protein